MTRQRLENLIWDNLDTSGGETACWEWQGNRGAGGYGLLTLDGKSVGVHRVVYWVLVGEIPEGMCVCHHCDNPPCCNPAHLFVGSIGDNIGDMFNKGRNSTAGLRQ